MHALTISPRARIAAAAGVVALVAVGTSFAAFSDSGDVQSTFTSGVLDLRFDDGQDASATPYTVDFDGSGAMAPGDSATYDLVVFNSGTIDATGSLAVPTITNSVPDAPAALQDVLSLSITDESTGAVLYDGALTSAAFDGLALPAGGAQSTGTTLGLTMTMDPAATIGVGGQSVTVTLPFTATQA